jgi:phage FluMu protein Com
MARVPDYPTAASVAQKTMTRTIQCPHCGVVLNVPEAAAGRKLRCPKCATKFATPSANPADSVIAESGPASTMFPTRKGPASSGDYGVSTPEGTSGTYELPLTGPGGSGGDFVDDLPSSPAPLREMFDLPSLGEATPSTRSTGQGKAPADALALFQDEPKANRKLRGAEARAKARRCPSCGGVVAIGMSLCNTCGLDLDTGQRIAPLEVFDEDMPSAPRSEAPPMGVLFVGSLCSIANLLLSVASLIAWQKGQGLGFLMLLVVWIFGIYASVQFLRRKSIRPLFLALALGVAIGVVFLIALPIWEVNAGTDIVVTSPDGAPAPVDPEGPQIRNIAEELDVNRITWGIAMLLTYAALSVYLNSPSMRREFNKR